MDAETEILEAMLELLEASRAAREALSEGDVALVRAIDRMLAGQRAVDILRSSPVSSQRQATQEALDRFNIARHKFRRKIIEMCLEQGMLPGQMGKIWGVSRQRIDRYVQEIRRCSGA